jgi:hypothetical protein
MLIGEVILFELNEGFVEGMVVVKGGKLVFMGVGK